MEPHNEMHRALAVLRGARSLAIQSFKRNFPELYAVSANAFETMPPGSFCHHERLGEYLTEWSNSLGKSPLEALASGSQSEVLDDLGGRIEDAPESVEEEAATEPEQVQHLPDESRRAYLAFCNYYSTGEGVSVFIAAASSAEGAKENFLQQTPDYFHGGMQVESVYDEGSSDANCMRSWMPKPVLDLIASNPPGTTNYFAKLHYNLA